MLSNDALNRTVDGDLPVMTSHLLISVAVTPSHLR